MSNLNINRTGNDPNDNVIRRYSEQPINYKEVGFLIVMISAIAFVIWLILFISMKIECYWTCGYMVYIFLSYTVLIGIGLVGGIIYLVQWLLNSSYLSFRGMRLHRKDIRSKANHILEIGKISAESEATAGIDTWSPTGGNTTSTSTTLGNDSTDTDATFIPMSSLLDQINKK